MIQKICNFGVMNLHTTHRTRWLGNGLKLFLFIWMLMKTDVGWGQCHQCNADRGPVLNPNILMDNFTNPINGDGQASFQNGFVTEWNSAYNTPHHVQIINNTCVNTYNIANGSELNCLASRQLDNYTEGIYHDIQTIQIFDPSDIYTLSLDVMRLPCSDLNGSAFVHIRMARGLTPYPIEEPIGPPPNVNNLLLESVLIEDGNINSICEEFSFQNPNNGFNQIYIHTENILPGNQATFISANNVLLSCRTTALVGILEDINNLEVDFEADWESIHQDIVTYLWDFGDGNTSTLATPNHNYAQEGYYEVCLTITNNNGCCATFCREIMVGCPTPESTFNIVENSCGDYTFTPQIVRENTVYIWTTTGGNPIGGIENTYTTNYSTNGVYTVSLTSTNQCGTSTMAQNVTVDCQTDCNNLSGAYLIQGTPQSNEVTLSSLLSHPSNPIPHELVNGTIKISNLFVHLDADLIIDVKTEFLNTQWFCEGGTLIDIRQDLTMKISNFEACDQMWKGFKHNFGRWFRFNDCIIKDAEFGVEISGNAKIWSRKNIFEDCYAGIRIPTANQTQNVINTFIQTDFFGTNTLKSSYPGQLFHNVRMFTGIWASNTTNLNIQTCQFINLMYAGIHSIHSSLSCSGSTFKDNFSVMRGVQIFNNGPK